MSPDTLALVASFVKESVVAGALISVVWMHNRQLRAFLTSLEQISAALHALTVEIRTMRQGP